MFCVLLLRLITALATFLKPRNPAYFANSSASGLRENRVTETAVQQVNFEPRH